MQSTSPTHATHVIVSGEQRGCSTVHDAAVEHAIGPSGRGPLPWELAHAATKTQTIEALIGGDRIKSPVSAELTNRARARAFLCATPRSASRTRSRARDRTDFR